MAMIALIRPVLFAFMQSDAVKHLILDLCRAMVEKTDNKVDDQLCDMLARALFND
jgi:hypothetical protein